MTYHLEALKKELRKVTIREITTCIKEINTTIGNNTRMLVSGKKEVLVGRLAKYINNQLLAHNFDTVAMVVDIVNKTASKKLSWTLNGEMIEINSKRPTTRKQVPAEEISFKPSPFFKQIHRLGNIKMCPISSNARQSKSFQFTLSNDHQALLNTPGTSAYEIRFYCARYAGSYSNLVLEFPSVCELKINESVIQGNSLRCIKGRPGTVNPPDITSMIKKQEINNVELVYINNEYQYIAGVYIVERTTVSQLIQTMKEVNVLTKDKVLEKLQQTQEDADIIMESETLRIRDPLAFTRINTPIRSKICPHLQCFDADVFFTMNEQTPTWTCPVCNRRLNSWEDLIIDEYFSDMLANTPSQIDSVRVEPNGHITIIDEISNTRDGEDNKGNESPILAPVKAEPIDIITILLDDDEPSLPVTNNVESGSIPFDSSSRKQKRKFSETADIETPVQKKQKVHVIDLTLDSDDDNTA